MLKILQIITLLQGVFLIVALMANREKYQKPTFWLFIGSIVSILFYVVGDDENGFFVENVDWFFFDSSLFITFLLLFVLYFVSRRERFKLKHLVFFLPNLLYFIIEFYEKYYSTEDVIYIEILELLVELSFLCYLLFTAWAIIKSDRKKWMAFFILPLAIIMSLALVNEIFSWLGIGQIPYFSDPENNASTLIVIAFLFYFMAWKLVVAPSEIVPFSEIKKYRTSGLKENLIEDYSKKLIAFMEDEKGFMDGKLSLSSLAEKLEIPKQYISEILNTHMNTNFQDFVNGYRIEAFLDRVNDAKYSNYSLVGIANDVGFSSKSSFYATFKKHKGVTPTEYRKLQK
ncbi:helix-turn-helix domain-containing protein [Aequorivita lipolytica]|uniref:Helix-turn-helix domain-containing protein n=1 Tax=Aequorivita lipolytica TaxID=153267 RepID=A0A5C6YN88_9FLAO|nr:helix-turn-helix domain-containing protein [Aequorivita lipolytica]TXD68744.1 helix-turn-helix domain-containing protein [Aequorivita lipolytica]SRX53111.1 Melibiose operon regulatory protein [Aequorivita lipolytica]